MKKDKKQVIGEMLTDEQVRSHLQMTVLGSGSIDFQLLLRAYRSLREDDFARFVSYFVAEGRDVNAVNEHGQKLAQIISTHRHAQPYLDALQNHAK